MTIQEIIDTRRKDRDTVVAPDVNIGYEEFELARQSSPLLQKLCPKVEEQAEPAPLTKP